MHKAEFNPQHKKKKKEKKKKDWMPLQFGEEQRSLQHYSF
jgi:hypothetical protein